jgi:hypothetical protein
MRATGSKATIATRMHQDYASVGERRGGEGGGVAGVECLVAGKASCAKGAATTRMTEEDEARKSAGRGVEQAGGGTEHSRLCGHGMENWEVGTTCVSRGMIYGKETNKHHVYHAPSE